MKKQREADRSSAPHSRAHTADAIAKRAVARMPTTVSGHRVKLMLTLFLPRDVAEYLAARAIGEGKNTPGVIGDIPHRGESAEVRAGVSAADLL